jgi:hypothetical protein
MSEQILFPNSGLSSYFNGTDFLGSDNVLLQSTPLSGVGSPAYFIKDGTISPSTSTFWKNTNLNITNVKDWMNIPFDITALSPSGATLRVAYNLQNSDAKIWFTNIGLYFLVENNPSLPSGNVFFANSSQLEFLGGNSGVLNIGLNISEVFRPQFPIPGVISVSGEIRSLPRSVTTSYGSGDNTFIVPPDVTELVVSCIGGGGNGDSIIGDGPLSGGTGGGGGAYASSTRTVTPNDTLNLHVGTGDGDDTWFINSSTVLAKAASGSTGGAAGSSIGDTTFSGGNGDGPSRTVNCGTEEEPSEISADGGIGGNSGSALGNGSNGGADGSAGDGGTGGNGGCDAGINNPGGLGQPGSIILVYDTQYVTGSGDIIFYDMDIICSGSALNSSNSNSNLYTQGHIVNSGTLNLYTRGIADNSGTLNLYTVSTIPSSGYIDLYTSGTAFSSGNMSLYLRCDYATSGIDLYTYGYDYSSGNTTLFCKAIDFASSGDITLYTYGHLISSGSNNLFIWGFTSGTTPMNLFLKGQVAKSGVSNFPLFMFSTTNSGIYSNQTLYLESSSGTPNPNNAMNLYTVGPSTLDTSSSMNLVVYQDTTPSHEMPLFIGNYYESGANFVRLFVMSPSGTEGAVPLSGSMNLYMSRDYDSIANNVSLVIKQNDIASGIIPLVIFGTNYNNSGINTYIGGIYTGTDFTTLYMNGYGGNGVVVEEIAEPEDWTPEELSNMIAWYKADSLSLNDDDAITTWIDSSNNSHDATQSTGVSKPLYKTGILNSLPAVRFSSNKSLLLTTLGTALTSDDTYTVFILLKPSSISNDPVVIAFPSNSSWTFLMEVANNGRFYWGHQNGNYRLYSSSITTSAASIISLKKTSSTTAEFWQDGTEITSFSTAGAGMIATPSMTGDMILGSYTNASFAYNGDIFEIVICNSSLSINDREKVEGYLAWKWGLEGNLPALHTYKSSPPTV